MPRKFRVRDYAKEYQQRQAKARREGYGSYGAKRWQREAPKRAAKRAAQPTGRPRFRLPYRVQLEQEAFEHYRRLFGTLMTRGGELVRDNLRILSDGELRMVLGASETVLRGLARQAPIEINGHVLNPYWYH